MRRASSSTSIVGQRPAKRVGYPISPSTGLGDVSIRARRSRAPSPARRAIPFIVLAAPVSISCTTTTASLERSASGDETSAGAAATAGAAVDATSGDAVVGAASSAYRGDGIENAVCTVGSRGPAGHASCPALTDDNGIAARCDPAPQLDDDASGAGSAPASCAPGTALTTAASTAGDDQHIDEAQARFNLERARCGEGMNRIAAACRYRPAGRCNRSL